MYTSLPPYEVLSTKWLSYEDICRLKQIEEVLEIYYNSGQFSHTLNFLCSYFSAPYDMYDHLASWYEEHNLFGVQSSRTKKYEIILEFGKMWIDQYIQSRSHMSGWMQDLKKMSKRQYSILREYITYDLYLREHMKNRPSFAPSLEPWKDEIHNILYHESKTHEMFPKLCGYNYRELTKTLHVEIFEMIFDQPTAVIFCYEQRDPLTYNCMIVKNILNIE